MIRFPRHRRFSRAFAALLCAGALSLTPRAQAQNSFGTIAVHPVAQSVRTAFSADSLHQWVRQLSGDLGVVLDGRPAHIAHRTAGTADYDLPVAYTRALFERWGYEVTVENAGAPWLTTNVVAVRRGTEPGEVLLTAHLDAKSQVCPGADDNASGCAVVLEAARVMRHHTFRHTLRFVLFGGEERGLLGSRAYAEQHEEDSIRAVVNCDMLLWDGNGNMNMQIHRMPNEGGQRSTDLAEYITAVDVAYNTDVICVAPLGNIGASDHASFWDRGNAAVLLIEEYGLDFNPYYHSDRDSWMWNASFDNLLFFNASAELALLSVTHLARPAATSGVEASAARSFAVEAVSPQPVRDHASVRFAVERAGAVRVRMIDLLGREVAVLADGVLEAGSHVVNFARGGLPPGAYVVLLEAGTRVASRTILID